MSTTANPFNFPALSLTYALDRFSSLNLEDTASVSWNIDQFGNLSATASTAGIANVQIVLPTDAIDANSATDAATVSMPGLLTTSTFSVAFATDPTSVTGWGTTGGLTLVLWPTADTLNWRVINQTASPITPGAMTANIGAK